MTEPTESILTPTTRHGSPAGVSSSAVFVSPRARVVEGRAHEPFGFAIASSIHTLLRSLLAADGRRDADARVVESVRTLVQAEWAGLFQREKVGWVCRSVAGPGPNAGEVIPPARADSDEREPRSELLLESLDAAEPAVAIDLDVGPKKAVLLLGSREGGAEHGARSRDLLMRVAPDLALALRKADELDKLRSQAFVDALTGCYNRRGFDEHLHVELHRAHRYDRSTALMLVDLDDFKEINDELGHQAGDHVLRRFAALLTSTFRATDIVSRYGGDEFAVIFPETTTAEAVRLVQRLRQLLGEIFPDSLIPLRLSASFGIASYPGDAMAADALIATADNALYAAKAGGRDRVVMAPPREIPE